MTPMLPTSWPIALAAVLFVLGLVGAMVRRNVLLVLVSMEVMLNAAGLAFVAAGSRWHAADGQVMFLFILAVAAAEVAVALAFVVQQSRRLGNLDVDAASRLKG
jgi:NADH-quinone oxidoreductase subunit K